MEEKTINTPSISCGHCVMTIKGEVGEMDGVTSVDADEKTKKVTVKWDPPATWDNIANKLREIGHPAGE
jgi:copper ion binding protein